MEYTLIRNVSKRGGDDGGSGVIVIPTKNNVYTFNLQSIF